MQHPKAILRVCRKGLACAWIALWVTSIQAGPMGFKESWMWMGDFSPNWQESFLNYAITTKDALGMEVVAMRSDDKQLRREAMGLTYTRLAQRWNLPQAQANVWLFAGASNLSGNGFAGTRTLLTPGIQIDYETTRIYLAATARWYRASGGIKHDYVALRTGFSFYDVNYDETQPWIVVEARRMRGLSEKTELTPMLRLIHNRYFVEAGVSNTKQIRLNWMHIF